jgi:hypothetical protein
MALVLMLASLILAAVMIFGENAINQQRSSTLGKEIATLQQILMAEYESVIPSNGSQIDVTAPIVGSQGVPSSWVKGGYLMNPFHGQVDVTVATSANVTTMNIAMSLLPKDACWATTISAIQAVALLSVTVNGSTFNAPFNGPTIVQQCAAGPNTLVLAYGNL